MAQYITLNENQKNEIINAITQGGGGSSSPIEFNSTQWTQLINAITQGGGGGGGGSVTFTELEKIQRSATNTTFTLNYNFSDYDIIIFEMYATSQTYANQWVGNSIVIASDLTANAVIWLVGGRLDRSLQIQIISDNEYQILQATSGSMIYGIYGIKF